MADLVQLYGEKIRATYAANLAFFEEKLPTVYQAIMTGMAGVRIDANIDEGGIISLSLDDHPLPLGVLLDQAKETMESFECEDPEARPIIEVRHKDSLPTTVPEPNSDPIIRDYYYSNHDNWPRIVADREFIERCGKDKALGGPDFGKRVIPILLVFGSGYGSHLIELLDRYTIRHLIIVDNDPAITRLSLGFTDYVAIFNNHLLRHQIKLSVLCSDDAEALGKDLIAIIQQNWPPFFIHGIAVFRNLRNIQLCEQVEKHLTQNLWLSFRGWGFFDDEMVSIRQTIANLQDGRPMLLPKSPVDGNAVAFVVANGPSLDVLADLIRAHAGKAIVISCGSAISALARLDIVPDYHIEIERPYLTAENLLLTVPPEFIAKVRVVAPSVVHPEVFNHALEGLMFAKAGDSAGETFPATSPRIGTFPTVSNGALAWLLNMGFKQIYLIGTDLGARDKSRHHSSHSMYFNKDDLPEDYVPHVDRVANLEMGMEVEANFGGTVFTEDIFTLARIAMEREIAARCGPGHVFNLSDGALIKGATPLRPEDFTFPENATEKTAVIAHIREQFGQPEGYDAKVCRDTIRDNVALVVDGLKPVLASEANSKLEIVNKFAALHTALAEVNRQSMGAYYVLRGSLLHHQRCIYDYMTFMPDEAEAVAFSKIGFESISKYLDDVLADVESIDAVNGSLPILPAQVRRQQANQPKEVA